MWGGAALDLESVPTIINKKVQYNVTKIVGPLEITLEQRGVFSMLELKVKAVQEPNNINKNINYLELIKALEELGIHTKKGANPFYFILNFKAISYFDYPYDGVDYIAPKYSSVETNCIVVEPTNNEFKISRIFGINLDKTPLYTDYIYKIIGYWTNDDNLW